MNVFISKLYHPISRVCSLKQLRFAGVSYSQLLSRHKKQAFNQTRSYETEDPYEKELEELRYQQLPEQDIAEPTADNVYPITNVAVVGYDCSVVEHFAQYVHYLASHMGINVKEMYAISGKSALVHTIRKEGVADNLKPKDFSLKEHERIIQVQDLSSTIAPIFLEVLLKHIPQGLVIDMKKHTQDQFQSRYIRKEVPEDL